MSRILTAYFSASGVTEKAAKAVAKTLCSDLFEIRPQIPYTEADLDWRNSNSRSSVEMNDKSFRPAIIKDELDTSSYDTVVIGFPVWWYVAPTIINTFLEAHDFSGKTIVVFATSGSSGMGKTVEELKVSLPENVKVIEGKVFRRGASEDDITAWASSLKV